MQPLRPLRRQKKIEQICGVWIKLALKPRYNIAPGQSVLDAGDADGMREAVIQWET